MFRTIYRHYADVAQQLKMATIMLRACRWTNTALVLIPSLHLGIMPALEYACSLSQDCRAIHIETDPEKPRLERALGALGGDVPLVILHSPFRSLMSPVMGYLDAVQVERRNHLVTVIVPEFVPTKCGTICCMETRGCC